MSSAALPGQLPTSFGK